MNPKKYLPLGISDFRQMITGNFLYVDKTQYIYEMVRPPQGFYFLARPRRFGKSLTVSTLESLFLGQKELFKGLWIDQADWDWKEYQVIKIDFNTVSFSTPEQLEENLILFVDQLCSEYGIDNPYTSLKESFSTLLTGIYRKTGTSIVILVDEYDKPFIDHLGRGDDHLKMAGANRDILKAFLGVLKGGDVSAALRFVFITGISKFTRVSIFSDLNNLNDISMQDRYGAILGYTAEELKTFFKRRIETLAQEQNTDPAELIENIHTWYDGYRFTDADIKVFNPFSVVNYFNTGKFRNYWFETATPTFLANLIQEKDYPVPMIENLVIGEEDFTVYELEDLHLEPLLFQTGYITIQGVEDGLYNMGYPNQEVKRSFLGYLYRRFFQIKDRSLGAGYKKLYRFLAEKQVDLFMETAKSILAAIPYTQMANQNESFYHTLFYLMLSASGVYVHTEVLSNVGRIDITAEFSDKIYIIELKCNQDADLAICQILEKRYYEKYLQTGKQIFLMGINFDSEERNISDWKFGPLEEWQKTL